MIDFKDSFEFLGTVVPDQDLAKKTFTVKDFFRADGQGPIVSVNASFCNFFTIGNGVVELPQAEGVDTLPIHVYSSRPKAKWNQQTIDLLGGLDSVVMSFRDMFGLLEVYRKKDANDSYLGLRGRESCFFARDRKNIPRRIIIRFTREGKMTVSACANLFDEKIARPTSGTRFFSFLEIK
jgi:hypothetical protein